MRHVLMIAPWLCLTMLLVTSVQAQGVRDPMRPPGATAAASSRPRATNTLKLEGVIAGPVRVAIVNGRLVRAGDEVAGARILEVLHDGVRYSRAGKIHSLLLPDVRALAITRLVSSPEATKP